MPYAAMHFPTNAGSIFLTDDLTNDRYLVDTKATSVLFLVHQIAAHLEKMGYQSPLGALFPKLSSFRTNFSLPIFCKLPLQVPFWALIFEQVQTTIAPETSQILFACAAVAQPAAKPFWPSSFRRSAGPPAPCKICILHLNSSLLKMVKIVCF